MAVTAQQIADLAGVSRGTVDRALHNRGRVSPEVKEKIQKIAAELGYKPNLIGQALVRTRQNFKLGVIIQSNETPTMQIVRAGVLQATEELAGSGVEVVLRDFQGLDTELMLEYIEELVSMGVQGIALTPDTAPEVRQCIDELHARGIPVITLNADAPGSKRLCFIGMDNYRAGQTAACLLRLMMPEGGTVLPLAGHLNNTAHNNRLNGFLDTVNANYADEISMLAFQPCFDRDDYSHEITQHALKANPDLAAIYVASNGQQGVCQAHRGGRPQGPHQGRGVRPQRAEHGAAPIGQPELRARSGGFRAGIPPAVSAVRVPSAQENARKRAALHGYCNPNQV